MLAVQYQSEEQFAGGSLAVANHISQFVKNVDLLTGLGRTNSHEEFIRDKLKKNINPVFLYFKDMNYKKLNPIKKSDQGIF